MNFQYGVSSWCCVDALMLYWERKQQEQFLKFLIRNYSMPSHTSYQVLLMFQFIFNMLVCPCTGHVLFSWDKPCLLIGSPHQYSDLRFPNQGASHICQGLANPVGRLPLISGCLHIGDFPVLIITAEFHHANWMSKQTGTLEMPGILQNENCIKACLRA